WKTKRKWKSTTRASWWSASPPGNKRAAKLRRRRLLQPPLLKRLNQSKRPLQSTASSHAQRKERKQDSSRPAALRVGFSLKSASSVQPARGTTAAHEACRSTDRSMAAALLVSVKRRGAYHDLSLR